MKNTDFFVENIENVISPQLLFYKKQLKDNLNMAIKTAGSVDRLWPHVKSHKIKEVVHLQMKAGITKFKCSTIAEAEMVASVSAKALIVAYPLVGPNISRFVELTKKFPKTICYAIGDNLKELELLGKKALDNNTICKVLLDVDMGSNRTGVSICNLFQLYVETSIIAGLSVEGLHCYDGNNGISSLEKRQKAVTAVDEKVFKVVSQIKEKGLVCSIIVMGGTPSFPCHAIYKDIFLSPGTLFISDYGYSTKFKDMNYPPAAAVLTRVVSLPKEGIFTIDLGYKGIASNDVLEERGHIVGLNHAIPISQNEEHLIFKMEEGFEWERPEIGEVLYIIPGHICPTTALYPSVFIVENHKVVDEWKVAARNRKITI